MHSDNFVIKLVIAARGWKESISVSYEQVEDVDDLNGQAEDVHLLREVVLVGQKKLEECDE